MANVEFVTHIDDVLNATSERLMKAAETIGGMMESKAKTYITDAIYSTPSGTYVRTGNLRNSITHDTQENKHDVTIVVGSAVEYAPYVELGTGIYAEDGKGRKTPWKYQDQQGKWHTTRGMPARPYLRPAVENHIREYQEVLHRELDK